MWSWKLNVYSASYRSAECEGSHLLLENVYEDFSLTNVLSSVFVIDFSSFDNHSNEFVGGFFTLVTIFL